MEELFLKSDRLINRLTVNIQREIPKSINWNWRLNSILGARGTVKTTLLLQRAKIMKMQNQEVLYVSLDPLPLKLVVIIKRLLKLENAYLILDDLEIGFGSKIPLWLFGFLY